LPDNSESVFDDLAALRFVNAARNLHAWSRATRKPFIELAWRLFVPERRLPESAVDLLSPSLRTMLADAPVVRTDDVGRRSNRTLRRLVLEYALGNRLDFPYRSPDIVYAYPFAHRPLVEFVLAIPGEELSAPGIHRALMRRAFGGFLPPRIANRTSKGYYPPAAFRRLRQEAESIADVGELHVVRRGWIDAPRLREALRTLTDGGGATGGDLLRVLRLEQWLRARQHAPAIPHRKEVNSHAVLSA
ncbi:MAG TPA: asparagine synthase-related protein, partial [Vicinamibacterales bacterium]